MKKSNDYVRNFLTIFFARKPIIIAVTLLIIVGVFLFAFLYPPTYGATSSVILKGAQPLRNPEGIEKTTGEMSIIGEKELFSEIEIILANVVAQKTVDELIEKGFDFGGEGGTEEKKRQQAISQIRSITTATLNPRSSTITIQTTWNNPEKAKTLLSTMLDNYFKYRSEVYKPREAETFFAVQLEKFSNELQEKENELRKLTEDSQTPNTTSEMENNLLNMKSLERQLFDLKQAYFDQKFRVDLMETDIRSSEISYFSYIKDTKIQELSNMVLEIMKQRNEAARIFHPESPKIQAFNKQIESAMVSFKREIGKFVSAQKSELENITRKMEYVENQIKTLRDQNMSLYEASTRSKMLVRQIAVLEESYTTFTKRLEEAKISNTYQTNTLFSVSLLTRPEASSTPVFPDKTKVIPMGIIAGIIMGIATGFLMEFFNHTFKTPEDIENNTGMTYIFSIPE